MKLGKLISISTLAVTAYSMNGHKVSSTSGYFRSTSGPFPIKSQSDFFVKYTVKYFQKNKEEKQKDKKARLLRRLRKEAPVKLDEGVVVWNEGNGNFR